MIAVAVGAWLYLFGFAGLNAMSRDFSNIQRTRKTWLALIFWPVSIPAMALLDLADGLKALSARK